MRKIVSDVCNIGGDLTPASELDEKFDSHWHDFETAISDALSCTQSHPLTWNEQVVFFNRLDMRARRVALFMVNSGASLQQVLNLKWQWEHDVPNKDALIFMSPKSPSDVLILNSIATRVFGYERGRYDSEFVFGDSKQEFWRGVPFNAHDSSVLIKDSNFKEPSIKEQFEIAWEGSGLPIGENMSVYVEQSLKETFQYRLTKEAVPFEDIDILLGVNPRIKKSSQINVRYLLECVEKIVRRDKDQELILR